MQSTVWINEAHPAYKRAVASRATGYHIALASLAVEPAEEHNFLMAFLARWGKATEKRKGSKR